MESVYRVLSRRPGSGRLLDITYREYAGVFREACRNLGWAAAPRQDRRAGAGAGRAGGIRTQEQVMQRGRWQALKKAFAATRRRAASTRPGASSAATTRTTRRNACGRSKG